jgi:uncharacterized pyridoxal phosphate-containing UPF0001 family protein
MTISLFLTQVYRQEGENFGQTIWDKIEDVKHMVKMHMLGTVDVCAKELFQMKGQPTLEGHNFHII